MLYTKSKPKVSDYNPITHTSFYNQEPTSVYSTPDPRSHVQSSAFLSPEKIGKKIEKAQTNIFSRSGNYIAKRPADFAKQEIIYFSKTRPRNKLIDPISGQVTLFDIRRPKIESLDINKYRDRVEGGVDFKAVSEFNLRRNLMKPNGTVSGSLKREVGSVAYVDPFLLKETLRNN